MNKDIFILGEYQSLVNKLIDVKAKKYLYFGFNMRTLHLTDIHLELSSLISRSGGRNIETYEISKVNILLNSFYINLNGALDNLAWVIHYEFNVIDGASEHNSKRNKIGLFNSTYQESLSQLNENIINDLNKYKNWHAEIKKFRDPAAHRIPLYCPPGIVREEDIEKKNIAMQHFLSQDYSKDRNAYMDAQYKLSQVGRFEPVFSSLSDNEILYPLEKTINDDYIPFFEVASLILSFLKINRTHQSQ